MKYSIHLIDYNGKGSYLSVRDKTEFCKRTAKKHFDAIKNAFSKVTIIELEDENGEVIEVYTKEVKKCTSK